jgi:hypothetical protein
MFVGTLASVSHTRFDEAQDTGVGNARAPQPVDAARPRLVGCPIVKGESPLWGVLMSAVGASFVVVAAALVIVSQRAAKEPAQGAPSASATAAPDNAAIVGADATPPALPSDGGAPEDASTKPEADAGSDASTDAATTETTAPAPAAASAPAKPKSPTAPKKAVKPKPKKPR